MLSPSGGVCVQRDVTTGAVGGRGWASTTGEAAGKPTVAGRAKRQSPQANASNRGDSKRSWPKSPFQEAPTEAAEVPQPVVQPRAAVVQPKREEEVDDADGKRYTPEQQQAWMLVMIKGVRLMGTKGAARRVNAQRPSPYCCSTRQHSSRQTYTDAVVPVASSSRTSCGCKRRLR
jgi:hypothetical protein